MLHTLKCISMNSTLEIYTDGGCSGNPGLGAWAYVVQRNGELIEKGSAGDSLTTNNKMELTAVIKALEYVKEQHADKGVTLHTDSQYVKQGITSWIHNWKRNGWKTAAKKPVKNKELWIALDAAQAGLSIEWKWVPGHAGVELNELCDAMVNQEMDILKGAKSSSGNAEERTQVDFETGVIDFGATPANIVYIATSLDGYIADEHGGVEWLQMVPNPQKDDLGFSDFMSEVDAILMGRKTYETVLSMNTPWPYNKPLFVYSSTITTVPKELQDKVFIIEGAPKTVIETLNKKGYQRIYVDGGKSVQSFLQEELIDELIISTIPVLLGRGVPLFGDLPHPQEFQLISSKIVLNEIVVSRYQRK